jgi:hypothetical protein
LVPLLQKLNQDVSCLADCPFPVIRSMLAQQALHELD